MGRTRGRGQTRGAEPLTHRRHRVDAPAGFAPCALFARVALFAPVALAAAVLLGSVPAWALLAPQYYEQARREAMSVLLLAVEKTVPPASGFGACQVTGTVRAVERGTAYAPGQAITLEVPCVAPGAQPPLGGTIYQPIARLTAAPYGRAYLDAGGAVVLSQYEPLDTLP